MDSYDSSRVSVEQDGRSLGDLMTSEHYSRLKERGYEFDGNVSAETALAWQRRAFLGGNDVFIGQIAFDEEGNVLENSRALFVKKVGE